MKVRMLFPDLLDEILQNSPSAPSPGARPDRPGSFDTLRSISIAISPDPIAEFADGGYYLSNFPLSAGCRWFGCAVSLAPDSAVDLSNAMIDLL